jgi:molybdopterin synthase sulfur carrier subunit
VITASLYATFRLIAGVKTIDIQPEPGLTVKGAVEAILAQAPTLRSHWVDAAGELYPHVHIFVNGNEYATLPDGADTALKAGDTLDFFPPVAGG